MLESYKREAERFSKAFKEKRGVCKKKLTNRDISKGTGIPEHIVSIYVKGYHKAIEVYLKDIKFDIPA